ncbi:sporulation protein YabP [Natronobacillus azotifigens]|uniref:Sporulation protein YabP n=1 Tax=Natronobacillus azotifigens TaxID=472978 RepID=A0A9J6RD01_9BACI|nr:sporulation protein YabP [Natronobacillus azotifigens]MCZ0703594.1 sporulation protein YabP [Natronobacillus azotifigens]
MANEHNHYSPTTVQTEHQVRIHNRRLIEISGVKEVDSFDNEEFLLETVQGYLMIRGQNLQIKTLDVSQGNVAIKGKLVDFSYLDEHQGDKAKGFFSKLFK